MKKESLGRREGKKQGGGSKRSALTKQKNKRTANWDLSPQAPSFQKVSAEPSIISQGFPAQGWLGPSESCLGGHLSLDKSILGPPLCSPTFPRWDLPLPSGTPHPHFFLRMQKK